MTIPIDTTVFPFGATLIPPANGAGGRMTPQKSSPQIAAWGGVILPDGPCEVFASWDGDDSVELRLRKLKASGPITIGTLEKRSGEGGTPRRMGPFRVGAFKGDYIELYVGGGGKRENSPTGTVIVFPLALES